MSELPPQIDPDKEPSHAHRHGFRYDVKDWWCFDCDTVTDFCVEQNDWPPPDNKT